MRVACPYCGEPTWVDVDASGGASQRFVCDCEVCCRPIDCTATVDPAGAIAIRVTTDDGV